MKRLLAIAAAIVAVPLMAGLSLAANGPVQTSQRNTAIDLPAIQLQFGISDAGKMNRTNSEQVVAKASDINDLPTIQENLGVAPEWSVFPVNQENPNQETKVQVNDLPTIQLQEGR